MYDNQINPYTLNGFTQDSMVANAYSPVNSNRVLLFLYAPHVMPNQVLRSHMYQFTPDLVDALYNAQQTMSLEQAVSPLNLSRLPGGMNAIMPDAEGKIADTENWNNVWTFTLVIDLQQSTFNGLISPTTRKIASGFIYGEAGTQNVYGNLDHTAHPFILNGQAILVFTRVTNVNVRQSFNPHARTIDGIVAYPTAMEYVNEVIPTYYHEDMFIGTPSELMEQKFTSPTGFMDYNKLNLANIKEGMPTRGIKNELKSPAVQLSRLMKSIDAGIDSIGAGDGIRSEISTNPDDRITNPVDLALNTTIANATATNILDTITGLDTSKPHSMQELMDLYPYMEVYPFTYHDSTSFNWDIAPQVEYNTAGTLCTVMHPKQQFSSLASNVVQAIIASSGIATIAFSYRWYDGDGVVAGKNDAFNLTRFDLMVPRSPEMTKSIAETVKSYLDHQLFEVIHACCGEFEINVLADAVGTVLVDLRLFNIPSAQDGGFYQTDAKLGGIVNPLIGTINTINSNATSLADTTQSLIGRTIAKQDFPTSTQYA